MHRMLSPGSQHLLLLFRPQTPILGDRDPTSSLLSKHSFSTSGFETHMKNQGEKTFKKSQGFKEKMKKKKAVYRIGGNFSRTHSVRVDKQQREGIK